MFPNDNDDNNIKCYHSMDPNARIVVIIFNNVNVSLDIQIQGSTFNNVSLDKTLIHRLELFKAL